MTGSNNIKLGREGPQTSEAAMERVVFIGTDNDRRQEGRICRLKKDGKRPE